MDQNTHIVQAYDAAAEIYHELVKRSRYFSPDWIAKHVQDLEALPEFRVLDVGCGPGLNIEALYGHRTGFRADGVDISPKMLERARRTGRYQQLYTHDLHSEMPELLSDTYDLIIVFGCLELLGNVDVCLSECHRVLKANGTLWASFKRFEAEDPASPPRYVTLGEGGKFHQIGYSAGEILNMMSTLNMRVDCFEAVVAYITPAGFGCPYYVLSAHKIK